MGMQYYSWREYVGSVLGYERPITQEHIDMTKRVFEKSSPDKVSSASVFAAPGSKVVVVNGDNATINMGADEEKGGGSSEAKSGKSEPGYSTEEEKQMAAGIALVGFMGLRMLARFMDV